MNRRARWSVVFVFLGLLGMLVGAVDPLEGSFVILPCNGIVALGDWFARSQYRRLLFFAFLLTAAGIGAMVVLSVLGGIGGSSERSIWWGLLILPYPLGWITGLVGAVLSFIGLFRQYRAPAGQPC